MKHELSALQCFAQRPLQAETHTPRRPHGRLVTFDPPSPHILGAMQSDIGMSQQRRNVLAASGIGDDADTDGKKNLPFLDRERFPQHRQQPFGNQTHARGIGDPGQ